MKRYQTFLILYVLISGSSPNSWGTDPDRGTTHVGHEGRLHHPGLHPLEVDIFEEGVSLDAGRLVRLAP